MSSLSRWFEGTREGPRAPPAFRPPPLLLSTSHGSNLISDATPGKKGDVHDSTGGFHTSGAQADTFTQNPTRGWIPPEEPLQHPPAAQRHSPSQTRCGRILSRGRS